MTASVSVEESTTRVHWPLRCSHWDRATACGTHSLSPFAPVADLLTSHSPPEADRIGGNVAALSPTTAAARPIMVNFLFIRLLVSNYLTKVSQRNPVIKPRLPARSGSPL